MVDMASQFHLCCVVQEGLFGDDVEQEMGNVDGPAFVRMIKDTWCKIFGSPKRIHTAIEGVFSSAAFMDFTGDRNIRVIVAVGEAH